MTDGGADEGRWDFFVSYAEADREWAEWLAWTLEENGYRVLIRAWESVPGTVWSALEQEGLRRASRLLAVVTPAYLESDDGGAQWQAVRESDLKGDTRRLVPIMIETCAPGSLGMLGTRGRIDLTDLSGPADEQVARIRLLDGLRDAQAGRRRPDSPPTLPVRKQATAGRLRPAGPMPFPERVARATERGAPGPGSGLSNDADIAPAGTGGGAGGDAPSTFPGIPSSKPATCSGRTRVGTRTDLDGGRDADELRRLGTENPGGPGEPANWPAYEALVSRATAPHVLAVAGRLAATAGEPPEFRRLLLDLCRYHYARGRFGESRDLAERARRHWLPVLGPDHLDALAAGHHLARALFALKRDDHQRAYELDQDILSRRRRILPADHPDILASANSIVMDLRALGRFDEAYMLALDTWERRRRVLGDDHPDTLSSAANLAGCHYLLGGHPESLRLNKDVWERRRRVLGDHHPDTLASAINTAMDLYAHDDRRPARTAAEKAFVRCQEVLGHDHPWTRTAAGLLREWREQ
ncbi:MULTISPECIES: tetratricopeptide repeat protein [Protofrankia]|uniref:TIR protein n=1 Tax=Candidatus Protofrankia datiscae TaxID=2716812 RepID=F8B0Y6_9ACTN|nr:MULTISPECIES: toll/interleukin-1 receptor domain-containing protein [Protofrankia]AEH07616.1 TIR protein [Candidatus Protofrankia datiscae]